MEISPEIKKALEQLLTQDAFAQNIEAYTISALQTIFNQPQTQEIDCPPSYILALSHTIQRNQNVDSLLSSLPEASRAKIRALVKSYTEESELKIDNTFHQSLCDVKW